jgi:hypothetical protein
MVREAIRSAIPGAAEEDGAAVREQRHTAAERAYTVATVIPMSSPIPSPNWQKTLADRGLTLTTLELDAVNAAYDNMTQPDAAKHGKLPYTKEEYPDSPFGKLESDSTTVDGDGAAYALDPDAFQIMRYHNSARADQEGNHQQWVRFGLQRTTTSGSEFQVFIRPNMFQYPVGETAVNLAPADAADVARRINQIWPQGQRVVALLGAARMDIRSGMELIKPIQQLMANLSDVAYLTGGYRGESGNSYGVTRAGFDVPKAGNKATLVIMPRAGIADAHQTADALSIFGRHWGDDTPALSTASDAAVFIRHIPAAKVYGKWTEVEIANFLHRGKPLAILDPLATASEEPHFGTQVPIFRQMEEVAAFLRKSLPTPAMMRARQLLDVKETTMVPLQQFEKYMAVRLYFDGKEYARWVQQDQEGHQPFMQAGLRFSAKPEAFEGDRDLVLDGYWKDIMLLQHFKKLWPDGHLETAYARCRKQLEQQRTTTGNLSWWWDQVDRKAIDGIWFMWAGEHDPRLLDMLPALPDNEFYKAIDLTKK